MSREREAGFDCRKCKDYGRCTESCAGAEKYIAQDYVYQREMIPGYLLQNENNSKEDNYTFPESLSREKDYKDILHTLMRHKQRLGSRTKKKDKILRLHLKKVSDTDIAAIMNCTRQYIRKVICEFTK